MVINKCSKSQIVHKKRTAKIHQVLIVTLHQFLWHFLTSLIGDRPINMISSVDPKDDT